MSDIHHDGLCPSPASSPSRPSGGGEGQQKQELGDGGAVSVDVVELEAEIRAFLIDVRALVSDHWSGCVPERQASIASAPYVDAQVFTEDLHPPDPPLGPRDPDWLVPLLRLYSTTPPEGEDRAVVSEEAVGLDWEDVCGYFQVGASIAQGDGYWPSMVNVDATELSGSITSNCARRLAAMLTRAADACDSTMPYSTTSAERSPKSSPSLASTTRPESAPRSVSPSGSLSDTATQDGSDE